MEFLSSMGKNPNVSERLIEWQRFPSGGPVCTLHILSLTKSQRGGPGETNEHADRFNQRSPSGQLPLLAHWSWPELSSQTHHSMSKVPGNMSPCHSTCHTARRGWSRGRRPPWQGHLVGTADRTRYRATCSAQIWRTLGSLSMSANRLGDRFDWQVFIVSLTSTSWKGWKQGGSACSKY